jgi:hypothetical protein
LHNRHDNSIQALQGDAVVLVMLQDELWVTSLMLLCLMIMTSMISEECAHQLALLISPELAEKKCDAYSFPGQLLPKMCQCREDTGRLQPLHFTAGPNMIKAKAFLKHLAQAVHAFQLSYTHAQGVICRHFPGPIPSRISA